MKILIYLFVFTNFAYAQQNHQNQITLGGSYPVPANGTLKRAWEGIYGLTGSYERFVTPNIVLGIGLTYSRFHMDKDFLNIDNQGYFINPYYSTGYVLRPNEFLEVTPLLKFGKAWIRLHNKDINTNYDESGISVEPALRIRYFSYGDIGMNFVASYKIIFEPFAQDQFEDAKTIRYYDFGLNVFYKW